MVGCQSLLFSFIVLIASAVLWWPFGGFCSINSRAVAIRLNHLSLDNEKKRFDKWQFSRDNNKFGEI